MMDYGLVNNVPGKCVMASTLLIGGAFVTYPIMQGAYAAVGLAKVIAITKTIATTVFLAIGSLFLYNYTNVFLFKYELSRIFTFDLKKGNNSLEYFQTLSSMLPCAIFQRILSLNSFNEAEKIATRFFYCEVSESTTEFYNQALSEFIRTGSNKKLILDLVFAFFPKEGTGCECNRYFSALGQVIDVLARGCDEVLWPLQMKGDFTTIMQQLLAYKEGDFISDSYIACLDVVFSSVDPYLLRTFFSENLESVKALVTKFNEHLFELDTPSDEELDKAVKLYKILHQLADITEVNTRCLYFVDLISNADVGYEISDTHELKKRAHHTVQRLVSSAKEDEVLDLVRVFTEVGFKR